ncbi:DDE-type integrase/transposase/recombinase [Streptomyces olivoreticuli]
MRWCGDITYLPVGKGWMHWRRSSTSTRRVVGRSMAEYMRADLVIDALEAAVATRGGSIDGVIFHSDRGTQYASSAFLGLPKTRDTPVDGPGRIELRQRDGRILLRQH